jgi:hypothetical protein
MEVLEYWYNLLGQVNYVTLFFLLSIVYYVLIYFRYLKERRLLEAIIFLAAYFLPLYAIFKAKKPLISLLKHLLQRNDDAVKVIDSIAKIILSPILVFWIFWLFIGGYAVIKNIDLMDYLKDHFRKQYIKSKVFGFSLMILGLLLLLLPLMIYPGTGIWQMPFVTVSLLAYFIGAICVVIPKIAKARLMRSSAI